MYNAIKTLVLIVGIFTASCMQAMDHDFFNLFDQRDQSIIHQEQNDNFDQQTTIPETLFLIPQPEETQCTTLDTFDEPLFFIIFGLEKEYRAKRRKTNNFDNKRAQSEIENTSHANLESCVVSDDDSCVVIVQDEVTDHINLESDDSVITVQNESVSIPSAPKTATPKIKTTTTSSTQQSSAKATTATAQKLVKKIAKISKSQRKQSRKRKRRKVIKKVKIELDGPPYICKWGGCKKSFNKVEFFIDHVKKGHTHKSDVCRWDGCGNQIFHGNLSRHIAIMHLREKKECDLCGKRVSKYYLKNHKKIHTYHERREKFKCPYCKCYFDRQNFKYDLKGHIQKHHSDKQSNLSTTTKTNSSH